MNTRVVAAALMLALLAPLPAAACSCVRPGTVQEEMARSTRVFVGRVTDVNSHPAGEDATWWETLVERIKSIFDKPEPEEHVQFQHRRVQFAVSEHFKGSPVKTIRLTTALDSAACGVDFTQGQDYVVYANGNEGALTASLCSRTGLASAPNAQLPELRRAAAGN